MLKKIAAAVLFLSFLLAVSPSAETSGEELYYAADLSDGELPRGTDVTFGEDGYIGAERGALVMEASATYPPVSTVLFPYRTPDAPFTYGCVITVREYLSGGCWFSLCFGAENEDRTYQFTVFCGPDGGGACFRHKSGPSTWKTLSSVPYSRLEQASGAFIDRGVSDTPVTVSVAVSDGVAYGLIDGELVLEARIAGGAEGYVGIDGRGVKLDAENVTVSSRLPRQASASDAFNTVLYEPQTGIVNPPAVIRRDKNTGGEFSADRALPAAVLLTLRAVDGQLRVYDGAVDLGDLASRLGRFEGLALPAFSVSDETCAALLASYLTSEGIDDAFVVVNRSPLVTAFSGLPFVRIVMDMSSRDAADVSEIVKVLYSNNIRTVLLSAAAADGDTVYELHKRLVTVWAAGASGDTEAEAVLSGVDAVVTNDHDAVIGFMQSVTEPTVVRRPVVISDGGNGDAAPRGSLPAVVSALEHGASAVRVTVRNSRDDVPVISETELTTGMSAELRISESNVSALKTLTYTDPRVSAGEGIATLEELFEKVYRDFPDPVFYLQVFDGETVASALALAEEYDMKQRCVILSDEPPVLDAALSSGAAVAYTAELNVWDGRSAGSSLCSLLRVLVRYDSAYYGDEAFMPDEFLRPASQRGVFAVASSGGAGILGGFGGFTASSSETSRLPYGLYASVGEDGRIDARLRYYDGTDRDVTALCSIMTVSGEPVLVSGAVSGEGKFVVTCPLTAENGSRYRLGSRVLTVTEHPAETEPGGDEPAAVSAAVTAAIIAGGAAVVAGGLIILGVLNRKKRKNSADKD
ncbi:MAG: hypothetical protein J5585_10830 [Clostridia bacterium]|nr:hypothetical protein [Clostridia bacterium]